MTHDYTKRYWGHDFVFRPIDNGLKASISGWGIGISDGDFLIIPNKDAKEGENKTTRYRIESISYYSDPKDMWLAQAVFAPRDKNDQ